MTNNLDTQARSAGDRAVSRAYHLEFWPGMIGYAIVLIAVLTWGDLAGTSPWRFAWAVLPVLPLLWIVRALLRHIRRIDDYQRFLLLQGLGVGFAAAMVAAVTVACLNSAGLDLPNAGWIIYGLGMLGWAITCLVNAKR